LRKEIIESEKTQADFLKWKFILVAAVGSVSLGFTSGINNSEGVQILLCVVPLLCAYVDLISLHIMGRIITVGTYLMGIGNEYEKFVFEVRRQVGASPYVFEAIALHGSSLVLNLVLCALGFLLPERATGSTESLGWYPKVLQAYIYMGGIGLGLTILLFMLYDSRRKSVNILADKYFSSRQIPR
jgi:hypothetical protein